MNWTLVLALSLLQGITEFLPVSSSGHLRIAHHFFGETSVSTTQDVALHLATLLSVLWVFREEIFALVRSKKPEGNPQDNPGLASTLGILIIGSLPAGIVGVFLGDSLEELTTSLRIVGFAYLINAAILLGAHRSGKHPGGKTLADMNLRDAFLIGLAQSFAIVRGISRSGSTITAGLLLGYRAESAALFSFLLAIPVIGGASLLEFLPLLTSSTSLADLIQVDITELALSFVLTLFIGIGALRALLVSAKKSLWWPYSIYSILLGVAAILMG